MKIIIELYPMFESCGCSRTELTQRMLKTMLKSLTYHEQDHIHHTEIEE